MMRISLFLVGLLAIGGAWAQAAPPPAAPAAAPASPYSATVPVAGTSDAQRSAAIAAALTQVLQQVSPGFAPSPDMLTNASGYVRDYHYRRAASGTGLELQVDFDQGAVGRLVAQGGGTGAPATAGAAAPAGASSSSAPAGAAASGTGTLWVGGLDSTHAFAALMSLLRNDDQLHDVVPIGANDDGVLLQVGYSAPLATVITALEAPNGHLAQAAQAHPGADASLQWTP
ncbi:MAG: hypothetical protein OJF61_000636 [Rhodanobacteraceae bacterium]|jgi:hypothetical protein|nr:MAG: hypothetical protein OJF61_000636 [Rhodanobacteraceae bacterium]